MDEEILYPVCPHRNVPAAFQRFLGPDSGGFERFFPDERVQRVDGTLLVVRLRSKKAVRSAVHVVEDLNLRLSSAWSAATQIFILAAALLFNPRPARLPA